MHVEGLPTAKLCLVTLLSSERCPQFERFRLQHVLMVNKTTSFKTKFISNETADFSLQITAPPILIRAAGVLRAILRVIVDQWRKSETSKTHDIFKQWIQF